MASRRGSARSRWAKGDSNVGAPCGQELALVFYTGLQVLTPGAFEKSRFLAMFRDFIVFEEERQSATRH